MLFTVGTLFIVDFNVKKPSNKFNLIICIIVGLAVISILLFSKFRVHRNEQEEIPIIDVSSDYGSQIDVDTGNISVGNINAIDTGTSE